MGRTMATQWYIAKNGARRGPFSGAELQALLADCGVRGDDLVWCEGMPAWLPARNIFKLPRSEHSPQHEAHAVEDDFAEEIRIAPARPAFPGKLVSPGFFLFSILMFLLPWVEVRCNGFTAVTQSGLQSCFGAYTEAVGLGDARLQNQPGFAMHHERVKAAPLMWFYGLLLLAGLVLGLALPISMPRLTALASCAIVAFVLTVVQLSIGFPIAELVDKANANGMLRQQLQQQPMPMPIPIFGPVPGQGDLVWVSTTPWCWLGILMTLGATGGLAIEHSVIFANKRRRRRGFD